MRSSKSVLAALLLMAAGCPGDGLKLDEPDMPEAGRSANHGRAGSAPGKDDAEAGRGGAMAAAGSGAIGAAGKGGLGGAAGKGGASGSLGSAGKGGSLGGAGKGGAGGSLDSGAGKGGSGGSLGGAAGKGGAGGAPSGNVTKLGDISNDAQAQAVCDKVKSQIKPADLTVIDRGACTLQGLAGELQGAGDCTKLTAECLEEQKSSESDDSCTASDFPSCPDVTVDEFVACAKANLEVSKSYFAKLSCDSQLDDLVDPETPAACSSLFAKCPELGDTDG